MSLTHEQRERLPEVLAKATDWPWWDAGDSVNSNPHPICHAYMVNATNNANLIALAPAMAETIIEDGKTIAVMREALADLFHLAVDVLLNGGTDIEQYPQIHAARAFINDGAQS